MRISLVLASIRTLFVSHLGPSPTPNHHDNYGELSLQLYLNTIHREPMFPNMRKTANVGDEALKDQAQQTNNGFKVRPQPLGKELDKDAQVWEIYVQETDQFDTELVKEWNDSLDVLLIFAALFSAITTALVLESAKQLQPDPAEVSSQTLLAISQTLLAISNGQKDTSTAASLQSSTFVPSRTSVFVNALWFLSLSLSVAVSLVAMLSKSWCHAFMAKRSGPKYEQGQRRQRKWSGIERWGMESVFMYLPTLMHLALLLFAIGLAVYLWDINVKVASPVVALAVVSVLLYATATVLPSIYQDCPYSTPLSKPLKRASDVLPELIKRVPWGRLQAMYQDISEHAQRLPLFARISDYVQHFTIIKTASVHLEKWRSILRKPAEQHQSVEDELPIKREADDTPMDGVTSHMLCWLVEHCEDKRLVDFALQSVAGACCELPRAPLVESNVLGLIAQRIRGCFDYDRDRDSLQLRSSASLDSALLYARALSWLVTSDTKHGLPFDSWSAASQKSYELYSKREPCQMLEKLFDEFQWCYAASQHDDTGRDLNINAIITSVIAPTSHYLRNGVAEHPEWRHVWSWQRELPIKDHDEDGRTWSIRCIRDHLNGTAPLHYGAFLALIEATPHALINSMHNMTTEVRNESMMVIVQLVHDPACASIEFQHAIGLILTVAAMLMHSYPGWKRRMDTPEDFKARAVEVYNYYKTRRYVDSMSLIVFGLRGLLRKSVADSFSLVDLFSIISVLSQVKHLDEVTPEKMYTVPAIPDLELPIGHMVLQRIQMEVEEKTETSMVNIIFPQLLRSFSAAGLPSVEGEDFEDGLQLFCTVPHTQLRKTCLKVLNLGRNARYLDQVYREGYSFRFAELAEPTLMSRLLHLSFGTEDVYIAPYAMLYLWKMTERLMWEAEQQPEGEPATILAEVLQTEAFVLLKEKVPNLPATPRNVLETGLADVWYPLLAEMSGHKSTAQVVVESGILDWMQVTSEHRVKDTSPYTTELQQDGRKWLEIIQELVSKFVSVIDAAE